MRWINKAQEPRELTEWRAKYKNDVNFNYDLMRGDKAVLWAISSSLLNEQGHLCAYTGRRIKEDSFHIEHVNPQAHCKRGEDVAYTNIVACYPAPNTRSVPYGAHKKGDWPNLDQRNQFASPLERDCEERFVFNLRGEISSAPDDTAAKKTIEKLGLNDSELKRLRQEAIKGTLGSANNLSLSDARKRLKILEQANGQYLEPFCFVLSQALRKHISRLEYIAKSKHKK